jgi:23S rRNA pseudouridine1911/1915/1917 synthase
MRAMARRSDPAPRAPLDPVRPAGTSADSILRVFRVASEHAGSRVDVYLRAQLRNTSRTRAKVIAEKGACDFAGRRLRPSERVREGDLIALWREPFEEELELAPLGVVYEDPHLLVIDKPPLIAVHPTARHHKNTVIKQLERERPGEFLALIHRLDRETSGVLLLSKTRESERAFKRLLEDRTHGEDGADCRKTYLAITRGTPPVGLIDLPVEPDLENSLRVKMRIAKPGTGLSARTGVTILAERAGYALVSCELHTGRQHQIRLHLAALGCPVVGDKLYGPDERMLARAADGLLTTEDLELLELPRHALHAHRYVMRHAMTGGTLEVEAPLSLDLQAFWDAPR